MAIDLNKCTGCSACVIACQSENNIPVVGKDNVVMGREMQWIRIDRYFSGSVDDPEAINQPLGCVHCETAPCEYVCPVNATVHSDEGLNEMVYNRCIGTRYCSNNCPYKVRRFNFLDYIARLHRGARDGREPRGHRPHPRHHGEVHLLRAAHRARAHRRPGSRGVRSRTVSCRPPASRAAPPAPSCSDRLNDPNSKVSQLHADTRRYDLLHEIGTRPRTAYLARVRNPNPELAKAVE